LLGQNVPKLFACINEDNVKQVWGDGLTAKGDSDHGGYFRLVGSTSGMACGLVDNAV